MSSNSFWHSEPIFVLECLASGQRVVPLHCWRSIIVTTSEGDRYDFMQELELEQNHSLQRFLAGFFVFWLFGCHTTGADLTFFFCFAWSYSNNITRRWVWFNAIVGVPAGVEPLPATVLGILSCFFFECFWLFVLQMTWWTENNITQPLFVLFSSFLFAS